jgi:hypothetical protein
LNNNKEKTARAGTWCSGPLQITIVPSSCGIRVTNFSIHKSSFEISDKDNFSLFRISLKNTATGEMITLDPENDWLDTRISDNDTGCSLYWERHKNPDLAGVTVRMDLKTGDDAFIWKQSVTNSSKTWSVWKVTFPRLDITEPNPEARLFIPRGPGEVRQGSWREALEFDQTYPNGWYSMQFMALYNLGDKGAGSPGLYIGFHDPNGSARRLCIKSNPEERRLAINFETPAENIGIAGNEFSLNNEVIIPACIWQEHLCLQ